MGVLEEGEEEEGVSKSNCLVKLFVVCAGVPFDNFLFFDEGTVGLWKPAAIPAMPAPARANALRQVTQ